MSEKEMQQELDDIRDELTAIFQEDNVSKFVLNPKVKELSERASFLNHELKKIKETGGQEK